VHRYALRFTQSGDRHFNSLVSGRRNSHSDAIKVGNARGLKSNQIALSFLQLGQEVRITNGRYTTGAPMKPLHAHLLKTTERKLPRVRSNRAKRLLLSLCFLMVAATLAISAGRYPWSSGSVVPHGNPSSKESGIKAERTPDCFADSPDVFDFSGVSVSVSQSGCNLQVAVADSNGKIVEGRYMKIAKPRK
jgi:hypothetical protein